MTYKGLWINPEVLVRRMRTIIGKYGYEKAQSLRSLKKEREAWTTAIWAIGRAQVTKKEYWVEIETVENTPDTKLHFIDQSAGYNHIMTHNFEVVDWVEQVADLMEVIEKKCKRAYPEYFALLILARKNAFISLKKISSRIEKLRVPFEAVWLVGRRMGSLASIAQLYPRVERIDFDIANITHNRRRKTDFLIPQHRGRSTATTPLGSIYLPIP
jgi:hypothetical protein